MSISLGLDKELGSLYLSRQKCLHPRTLRRSYARGLKCHIRTVTCALMKLRRRRCIFISVDVVISTFRCNMKYSSGAQTLWWEYICVYVSCLQCVVVAFNSDFQPLQNKHEFLRYVCSALTKVLLKCQTGTFLSWAVAFHHNQE